MDILKITLPALLVLLTAYLMIDKLLKNEEKQRNFELTKSNFSITTPLRLRAYERLILVLERTAPAKMIVDIIKPDMTNSELHSSLLSTIRQEFSHNISQQIYVSDEVWFQIKNAQESLLQLVNTCYSKCNPTNPAPELAEIIIQTYSNSELTPTESTILKLKKEVRLLF